MKTIPLTFILFFTTLGGMAQVTAYSVEKQVDNCLYYKTDKWGLIKYYFENYLKQNNVAKEGEPIENAYYNWVIYRMNPNAELFPIEQFAKVKHVLDSSGMIDGRHSISVWIEECFGRVEEEKLDAIPGASPIWQMCQLASWGETIYLTQASMIARSVATVLEKEDYKRDVYKKFVIMAFFVDVYYAELKHRQPEAANPLSD